MNSRSLRFRVGGDASSVSRRDRDLRDSRVDWDDSETDLSHLKGAAGTEAGVDNLWEDNWDDDDVEDDFSKQLR